jgi:hypothetical protein
MKKYIKFFSFMLILLWSGICYASIDMWDQYFFRINVGQNSINWGWGGCDPYTSTECNNLVIGCNINPVTDTIASAENEDTGYTINIYNYGHPASPYEFGRRFAYDSVLQGEWVITAMNDTDTATIRTHSISGAPKMPFLNNVSLQGTGLDPVISWAPPSTLLAVRTRLNVIDRNTRLKLWMSEKLGIGHTSYQIPSGVLEENHPYLIRAMVEATDTGTYFGETISRAESYFDFTPLEENEPDQVFLPTVGPDPDPNDEFGSAFMFDINVEEGIPCFIDPDIAIGYDYATGEEDTVKFASVTLPEVGDNLYDLYLFNGSEFYLEQKDLPAGFTYVFDPSGVERFRVLGITKAAELSPDDTTAFITELTFTGTGRFTGTQTPITVFINDLGMQLVNVDIKPGGEPNCIKATSKGKTPISIFGSAALDVNTIDASTIKIGDDESIGGVASVKSLTDDVNGDGLLDLVLLFSTQDLNTFGLLGEGKTLYITGALDDGTEIIGSDFVYMAGGPTCMD